MTHQGHLETDKLSLPSSSWWIPVITGCVAILAILTGVFGS
jgi:hypothetical protein